MLQADRPLGIGLTGDVGFIPTASIINYLIKVEREADSREIDLAIRFIHALDAEYVAIRNKPPQHPGAKEAP